MSRGPGGGNPYTKGVAAFVAGLTYERIPAEVIARIKLLILDSLGCALYGTELPWSRILMATLDSLDRTKACAVWGTDRRLSAPMQRLSTAPWCRASNSTTSIGQACSMPAR